MSESSTLLPDDGSQMFHTVLCHVIRLPHVVSGPIQILHTP